MEWAACHMTLWLQ